MNSTPTRADYSFDPRPSVQPRLVPMADFAVVKNEGILLFTNPLGAGLGVAIHDPKNKVTGLLHSMLPCSRLDPGRAALHPGMFVDTGLQSYLKRAYDLSARKENLLVYIAGGARIMDESSVFNIGMRNYEILVACLAQHGLRIHAEDVGGQANRSLFFNTARGEVLSRISGQSEEKILCKR